MRISRITGACFVAGLPADLEAAVLVVLHAPADGHSALAAILNRSEPLPASAARPRSSSGKVVWAVL